jgi:nitroimidazol reductase NimA-like FMN-containing flavoprotein (pyridoxamine 5'-phosphate oxidase superfamily)
MSKEEREAFLSDVHVGVISIEEPGRGPLTAPIWYDYELEGELWIVTGPASRKGKLLQSVERFSLCAQTETPPYKYVSVEGPIVAVEPSNLEADERPMAHRYLGPKLGDLYIEQTGGAEGRVANPQLKVRMRPERWLSVDYAKQFAVEAAD